jgi:hypothetical protein
MLAGYSGRIRPAVKRRALAEARTTSVPTTSVRSVRRPRLLAVVQAALILTSLAVPIGALANVGTVTVNSASQSPSPVTQGSSATFTLTVVNTAPSTNRSFNAIAVSGVTGLSVSSSTCASINGGSTGTITVTMATTAATPIGSQTFTLTVADHNSPACTGSPHSTNTGTGTIVVGSAMLSQTISFGALADKRPDELPLIVAATASSGLTVSFSSATPAVCTVAGTTVSYVALGVCTIAANQAGDATYNPAPQVSQSFTIAKGDQTISFGALAAKSIGDPDFAVSATASSGLAVSFGSATPAVCTVTGTTVHLVAIGTCTIDADQAGDANWNAAPQVSQSFAVAAAMLDQTITFGALPDVTIGAPSFVLAATTTSGLPITYTSLTPAVCTVSGTTVTIVSTGTCTIRASQVGDATYAAAEPVTQSFAVLATASAPDTDTITPSAAASGSASIPFLRLVGLLTAGVLAGLLQLAYLQHRSGNRDRGLGG